MSKDKNSLSLRLRVIRQCGGSPVPTSVARRWIESRGAPMGAVEGSFKVSVKALGIKN
jgi:hypothetical protein